MNTLDLTKRSGGTRRTSPPITTAAGFEVGQGVWFIRAGIVVSGTVKGFSPWLTDATRHRAEVELVDDLKASVDTEDLFTGEVPALEWELAETHNKVAYLKSRLRELAKATAEKLRS